MNTFKDEILCDTVKLKQNTDYIRKAWTDGVGKKFFSVHMELIMTAAESYGRQVGVTFDKMQRTLDELIEICGESSPRPVFSGNPNERGDRGGATSSSWENIKFIFPLTNRQKD